MWQKKMQTKLFDWRTAAKRCSQGDTKAMWNLSRWFRSQLGTEFLALEKQLEKAPPAERREVADGVNRYLKQHGEEQFLWKASNFWMNRAALYGYGAAKAVAEEHPLRCLNAYFSPYFMLPIGQGSVSCRGEELNRLGLLQFTATEEYDIRGMEQDGTYRARVYRGYDGPDETGFGMEEEWDTFYYDEFFNVLKGNRQAAKEQQQQERQHYWSQAWNRSQGTPYTSEVQELPLQIIRDHKLILCSGIRHVTVPEGVTTIGAHAFYHNAMVESIALPDSLETVETYAFASCDNLHQIRIPAGVKQLGARAFFHSHALESVTLSEGLQEIGEGAFLGCHALREITLPHTIKQIGASAFMYCESLEQITLPTAIRRIEKQTFFLCKKLSRITMPAMLDSIGKEAFHRCPCEKAVAKKFPTLYSLPEEKKKFLGLL